MIDRVHQREGEAAIGIQRHGKDIAAICRSRHHIASLAVGDWFPLRGQTRRPFNREGQIGIAKPRLGPICRAICTIIDADQLFAVQPQIARSRQRFLGQIGPVRQVVLIDRHHLCDNTTGAIDRLFELNRVNQEVISATTWCRKDDAVERSAIVGLCCEGGINLIGHTGDGG